MAVTNDLVSDQRVDKVCNTLLRMGFSVTLIGRLLPWSLPMPPRQYHSQRMKLWFRKGPFFYAEFNIRLFFRLLASHQTLIVSNDLDTLPACWLASRCKSIPLVYDSHEFYTETPELINRQATRRIWLAIERFIFPRLRHVITVNESIADAYFKRYNIKPFIIKNQPRFAPPATPLSPQEMQLPSALPIVLLQGAGINIDRGAEEMVQAMAFIDNAQLLIVGSGDVMHHLRKMREELNLATKITILDKLPYNELRRITASATIGVTLDKDTNPNYRFSLPNKLFDYIQAGVPVLASRLPEIEKVILHYEIGDFILSHDPKHIADKISEMVAEPDKINQFRKNCLMAARELCWENQEPILQEVYGNYLR